MASLVWHPFNIVVCGLQVGRCCCNTRFEAARRGHYHCYKQLSPALGGPRQGSYPCLQLALHSGKQYFADLLAAGIHRPSAQEFAIHCFGEDDLLSFQWVLQMAPQLGRNPLVKYAADRGSVGCLKYLLQSGVTWDPAAFLFPAWRNKLDILQAGLPYSTEWHPQLPGVAAYAGNVRFLIRIFDAGCPVWKCAQDCGPSSCGFFGARWGFQDKALAPWTLVVSSDLVRSGPVLLLAAQKGATLTPLMTEMVTEVRARALALAGCFYKADHLSQEEGAAAKAWEAMGRVPPDIIMSIATLAKLSIVVRDLVA